MGYVSDVPENVDPSVPEADAVDDALPAGPTPRPEVAEPDRGIDVPEADALDAAREVPLDDDVER
jgi:hypothetical protein